MPLYLKKSEYDAGKAEDGGELGKQRGNPTEVQQLPYRHFKRSVDMLKDLKPEEVIRVSDKDEMDKVRAKTQRGQGWENYEAKEKTRLENAEKREVEKAAREAKKAEEAEAKKAAKAAEKEAAKAAKAETSDAKQQAGSIARKKSDAKADETAEAATTATS